MSFLSDLAKQKGRSRNESEYKENTCFNCKRTGGKGDIKLMSCVFALNPLSYQDFICNSSVCNYCVNEICHIFQNDFYLPNPDLEDGYPYIKNGGFFSTTKAKEEGVSVFVLGIRPNMPDDYHVLLIDDKYEKAIKNVYDCLVKGAERNKVKGYGDLLR